MQLKQEIQELDDMLMNTNSINFEEVKLSARRADTEEDCPNGQHSPLLKSQQPYSGGNPYN
jgi:hypothetical protein